MHLKNLIAVAALITSLTGDGNLANTPTSSSQEESTVAIEKYSW